MLECRIIFDPGQSNASITQGLSHLQRDTGGYTKQVEHFNDVPSESLVECILHSETYSAKSKCICLILAQDVVQYEDPK